MPNVISSECCQSKSSRHMFTDKGQWTKINPHHIVNSASKFGKSTEPYKSKQTPNGINKRVAILQNSIRAWFTFCADTSIMDRSGCRQIIGRQTDGLEEGRTTRKRLMAEVSNGFNITPAGTMDPKIPGYQHTWCLLLANTFFNELKFINLCRFKL